MDPFSRYGDETPILPPNEAKFVLRGLAGVIGVSGAKGSVLSPWNLVRSMSKRRNVDESVRDYWRGR